MIKKPKKLLCSLLGCAVLLAAPEVSLAEEASPEYSFDEYVITASRMPVKLTQTAANVTVITREEIEKGGFTSVPEILKKSNVNLEGTSFSTIPVLNGDSRVLVLVDGRRMNWDHLVVSGNERAGVNLNLLPSKNIERIEIVRGSASSLYGSDAVGGVINIITRKADASQTTVTSEFGSWGAQRYSLTTEGKEGDLGYILTAEKKKQDSFQYVDAQTGETKVFRDSQIDQKSVTLRLDKDLSQGRSLSLQVEHNEATDGFGCDLMTTGPWATGTVRYPGGYSEKTSDNMALTYYWGQVIGADNSLRVYHNRATNTFYNSLSVPSALDATGLNWQQAWKLNDQHTLIGGADWRQDHLNDSTSVNRITTTQALFIEDRWKLPSNWTVTAGTRYDHNSAVGGNTTSRVTFNREIDSTTNIYASWGQYVKNPTIAELFNNDGFWLGNPDLKPEKGSTVTIGMNTELGNGTKLQASAYTSNVHDAIVGKYTTFYQYYNVEREKRRGLDITLSRRLSPQWNINAGYSYAKIERKEAASSDYINDISNSQPNGYRLNLQYSQDKWDGDLTVKNVSGRSLSSFTNSSYTVLDMTLNYQMTPDTRIYLKGYNLTNQAYEVTYNMWGNIGGYPMPARSFYLGMEHRM